MIIEEDKEEEVVITNLDVEKVAVGPKFKHHRNPLINQRRMIYF